MGVSLDQKLFTLRPQRLCAKLDESLQAKHFKRLCRDCESLPQFSSETATCSQVAKFPAQLILPARSIRLFGKASLDSPSRPM